MNGGRLSNDETFLQGVIELRAQLAAQAGGEDAQRALARIAVRYPEEGEQMRALLEQQGWAQLDAALDALTAQHQADTADE